jgi:hypothetical protein
MYAVDGFFGEAEGLLKTGGRSTDFAAFFLITFEVALIGIDLAFLDFTDNS